MAIYRYQSYVCILLQLWMGIVMKLTSTPAKKIHNKNTRFSVIKQIMHLKGVGSSTLGTTVCD